MANEIELAYKYCPICGQPRTNFQPARPTSCSACEYTCFFGPVAAVCGVLQNNSGQVLFIERAKDPGRGMMGLPGGFVDPGETAEICLHREVMEEVGIQIDKVEFLTSCPNRYTFQGVTFSVLDLFFTAKVDSSQRITMADGEVSGWQWSDVDQSIMDRLAFESHRTALQTCRAHRSTTGKA